MEQNVYNKRVTNMAQSTFDNNEIITVDGNQYMLC